MADSGTADGPRLVLASGSPRRRILLAALGVTADIAPVELDEAAIAGDLPPTAAVIAVATAKAMGVLLDGRPVLAADTVVVCDGDILGKPTDRDDAARMLRRQSGRPIEVVSGLALRLGDGVRTASAVTRLAVDRLDDDAIAAYLGTGEADDKAGALAIQGSAAGFTTIVDGSRSNTYGLPLAETAALLRSIGIEPEPSGLPGER